MVSCVVRRGCAGDRQLLESLMFDAEATRGAMSGWLKENFEDSANGGTFRKYVRTSAVADGPARRAASRAQRSSGWRRGVTFVA